MILKSYEINKININKHKFILFYGENEGHKNQSIKKLTENIENILNYDEQEILYNSDNFLENFYSKSLFEDKKVIVIKRASEKILKILENIFNKNIDDVVVFICAQNLDRRSKLRSTFEKDKLLLTIPFYLENEQALSNIALNFFKEKNITLSRENINLIIKKCNGDRSNVLNELQKVEYFAKSGKQVSTESLLKLTNLIDNYSVADLVDNCLAKNRRRTIDILNENNFTNEDCILIIRTFLNKSKRILKLSEQYKKNKNIDLTISSAKPAIFWKDKDITIQQIKKWSPQNLRILIYKINEIELIIKKNINSSVSLITNFFLEHCSVDINN